MPNLTVCLKKVGDKLDPADKAAVLNRSRELRSGGMGATEAAKEAVKDVISGIRAELKAAEPKKPVTQPLRVKHPKTVMGSELLAIISDRLGGLDPSLISEYSVYVPTGKLDKKTKAPLMAWRNPPIPGIGLLFRRGGRQDRQEIAQVLEDADYLEPGAVANDYKEAGERAKDLIKAALDRNTPMTLAERQAKMEAGQEAERQAYYDALDEESALEADAERAAIMAEAELSRVEVQAVDDEDLFNMAGGQTGAEAMRAMGFSEQEIADELAREAQPQGQAAQASAAQDAEVAPGPAPEAGPAGVDAAQRGPEQAAEGLTLEAPTPDSLKARAARTKAAADADAKEQKRLADKAKADAERGDFQLTGSDRAADVGAAAGQGDIFDTSSEPVEKQGGNELDPPAKISDIGEKIGGARKDVAVGSGTRSKRGESEDTRPAWARRFQISQIVRPGGQINAMRDEGRWIIRDTRSLDWMKQPKQVGRSTFATQEEAEAFVPIAAVSLKHRAVPTRGDKYEIWRDITDRKRVKVVEREFDTRDEAMAYMAANAAAIIETNTTFGEADMPLPPDRARTGPERRTGNVVGEDFKTTFGFRGVEFGNWNNQDERQGLMNDAWDGLMDLADVLGIPPKAIGLNGDLALAFGARGHGLNSARAHYELDRAVINLTKERGAGSLAHEWFHALDHYFGRQDGKASAAWKIEPDGTRTLKVAGDGADMASSGFRGERSGVRPEVREAYNALLTTMFKKAESYVEDTAKVDKFTGTAREDLARELDKLRQDWSEQKDKRYWKRNNAPASAEVLSEFDAIAAKMLAGELLETDWRTFASGTEKRARLSTRWTNDAMERLSELNKQVRGRSGFDAEGKGVLDRLRGSMNRYSQRLKMLADAQSGTEKTKMVPTDFAMNAKELDQGRGGDYWTTPHEMAARAFQGYVEDKVAERGGVSRFLNYGPENVGIPTPWGFKRPFPAGAERKAINKALDTFIGTLQTRTDDAGNVALLSQGRGRGIPLSTLKPHIDAITAKMPGLRAAVEVVATVTDLPKGIVDSLRSMNALGTVRGLRMPDGRVFLVADKLDSQLEAEFVLFHEVYGHEGLRAILTGDEYARAMTLVRLSNKAVAAEADRWTAAYGADQIDARIQAGMSPEAARREVRLLAIEEALADRAGKNDPPAVWKNVMAAIQKALRRMGMDDLANWLENRTEAETYALLMQARKAITNPKKPHAFTPTTSPLFQRVWHGTPHEFEKFDTSAIGTGEGQQAYGYGLYFASRREVAEHYRKTLSKRGVVRVAGKELAEQHGMFAAQIRNIADAMDDGILFEDARRQAVGDMQFRESYSRRNGYADDENEAAAAVASLKALTPSNWTTKSGQLLEVEIPEDSEMLLWDRKLSEQPENVRKALMAAMDRDRQDGEPAGWSVETGQRFYRNTLQEREGSDQAASEWLLKAGIKGIKYLDGVSRNKPLRDVKREFLAELPEDAGFDEVMDLLGTGTFGPKNEAVLRALADNDWLGFDYPAQAISTALSNQLSNFDPTPELVQAVAATQDDSTYNYVIFSGDDVAIQQALLSRRPDTMAPAVTVQPDENGNPTFRGAKVKLDYPQPAERFEFIPSPGQQLLNYAIMPSEGFDSLGFVELVVENGQVTALLDIEINGAGRRAGVGKQVIETILAANPQADVNISNIVHQARGFWAKMGVPEQNLEDGAAYDGTLNWQTYAEATNDGRAAQVGQGMQGQVRRADAGATGADGEAGRGAQAPVLSQRSDLQAQAKALGLPATGASADLANRIRIVEAHPSTWTRDDFDAIAPYLSIHQDVRDNSALRVDSIMRDGLNKGMVDSLGRMKDGQWTWADRLAGGDAYAFVSGALKFKSTDSAWLAPGNKPLFHFTTQPGQDLYEAVKGASGAPGMPVLSQQPPTQGPIATAAQQSLPTQRQPLPAGWRDPTNRLQFAPGQWLYSALGRLAAPLLIKLQFKAAIPEMRRQLRQMKLDVQKAQDIAVAVAKETTKLSDAEREMVSDIIEREVKAGTVPPEHAIRLAALMNNAMGEQSKELIRLGMLTPEAAARWDGAYLPRFYESKLKKQVGDAWADALKRLTGRTSAMKGVKGSHLKSRGIYEPIIARDLEKWEQMGWEIRDPDYPPGTKAADLKSRVDAGLLKPDEQVQMWRDYTRDEREKMGEIRDAGFRFVMGYMQTQRDIALGRMFEKMANDPASSSRIPQEGWVKVPDSTIEGTGAKRYGKLSGRYVPKETLSHLSQIEESQSAAWQMYRQGMAIWKMGKTAMNPVSHFNNIVSNLSMAHFAGVGYHRADKYIAAVRDFATAAPAIKEARDAGLFLGTMSDAELMNTLPKELQELAGKAESKTVKGAKLVFDMLTFFVRKPMGAAYQAEDTFFRYLIYKDARGRGLSPDDAIDYAQKYIFTYDDLPKGARMVRDFGIPFFAYTYKAVPALLHTALTHPVRFAAPAAVLWAANAMAYAIAAGDDDDTWAELLSKYINDEAFREKAKAQEQLERENLPPWMKGMTALATPKAIRLGMDEVTKLPMFLDVARIIPGGDLMDVSPNAGGLPIPQPFTPSHPLFSIATGMIANKDLWTGKDLVDKNDTRGEAAEKRSEWVWKQVSPAMAIGNYHWERTMNALAQASGGEISWLPEFIAEDYTGVGRDRLPVQPGLAAMQTFGIKARPIDIEKSMQMEGTMRQKMIRDITAELRTLNRLNQDGVISDTRMEKERAKTQLKIDRLREGLTVDGDEKP